MQKLKNKYGPPVTGAVHCCVCRAEVPNGSQCYYDLAGPRGQKLYCLMCGGKTKFDNDKEKGLHTGSIENYIPETLPVTKVPPAVGKASTSSIEALIIALIEEHKTVQLDETRIIELIQEHQSNVKEVVIVDPVQQTETNVGKQHKDFEHLLNLARCRENIWIAGPAGSGKSRIAENIAKALGLEYSFTGAVCETYKLFGFISVTTGAYISTEFRKRWELGGIFCFDDFDASDPNAVIELNNLLANGHAAFPDGIVAKHHDLIIILNANTWGHGATSDYVGRMKQDAAFVDRFLFHFLDYDEDLERETCGNREWAQYVQKLRANARAKNLKVLITPRASYKGAKLLVNGISRDAVINCTIKAKLTLEQWSAIQ